MEGSKIEWTDETWNPVVGCDHVSEGCRNCYAETMSNRLASMEHSEQYDDVVDDKGRFAGGTVNTVPKMLEKPLEWDKPRRVFVNSMSDLFHPDVPFEFVDKVFAVMAMRPQHTFQILTKRPTRMKNYLNHIQPDYGLEKVGRHVLELSKEYSVSLWGDQPDNLENLRPDEHALHNWPIPNVWIGVSVEDQDAADERIPPLLECPAEVRFLSCEPLLGPVNLEGGETYPKKGWLSGFHVEAEHANGCRGECRRCPVPVRVQNPGEIDWVIAGGESGPGARPMHPDWVRSVRDQCDEADVPFFFKQWGAWGPGSYQQENCQTKVILSNGESADYSNYQEEIAKFKSTEEWNNLNPQTISMLGKDEAGRKLDGETHDEFPKEAN